MVNACNGDATGMKNHPRLVIATLAALVMLVAARHPTADFRIATHDATDLAPHQVRAAVDLGLMGVSVLYTWTSERGER
jgi:hypothetical protein